MSTTDETGKTVKGENFSSIVEEFKVVLENIKMDSTTEDRELREENKDLFSNLISDLEKAIGEGFKEGQKDQEKYIKDMTDSIKKISEDINSGDLKNLIKKQKVIRKEEKKLASFQLMKAFHKEQSNQLEKQTNVLQQILKCCEGGSSIGSQTSTISPSTRTSTSTSTSTSTDDAFDHSNIDGFFSKINKKDFKFENLFDGQEKSINQVLFGNQSMLKGMMAQAQSVSKSLLAIKDNQSLIQVFTEGTVESLIQYEQGMREALYLTAGAAKESHDLFATMAQIGNTVEITGFKQEETQKAMVKFAKIGVKYDGDAEKYKKKLSGLATTTLNTEKQLGLEAGSLQETFGDLYRFGVLNENSIANLGRGMREVSRTTGVSGEAFKKVLGTTQGIVDAMRKASTLTAASARNVTELGANAEKFGVSEEFNNINKALSSTTNLFNDASDGTRLLLFSAAASVGKLRELQQGTLTRSKEGIKSLTEGVNNVFKRFGIESADAIDQLSDSAKMQLNLVLKSSFDLELGQVKGVLKTLEASGKTFADKLLDLDKQLGKNISTEKRSAILEEQRKIKIDKNLDLLGILSEAAETSKTMNDAFSKFGTRRKEFESDLQALGLGGSNKDVIREAVSQSLTGVNAALSKAGLDKISISTAEMSKALEDPQSYQDLLSTLKNGEMKAAANSKGTLTGIDAVRFGIDKLNADIQKTIAGPLNTFLNQGMLTHIFTNAGLMLMPGIIAAIPSIVTAVIGMKILKRLPLAGATTAASTATSLAPAAAAAPVAATGLKRTRNYRVRAADPPVLPTMGQRFGNSMAAAGQGGLNFATGWAKFAANVVIIAGLLALGYLALSVMTPPTEQETEDLISKIKYLGIAMSAATVMVGELYLVSLAASAMSSMKILWGPILKAGAVLVAAGVVLPVFIGGLVFLTSMATEYMGINPSEMATSALNLAKFIGAGALVIAALATSLIMITGLGAATIGFVAAGALTGGVGWAVALGFLVTGAAMLIAAGPAVAALVFAVTSVTENTMSAFSISPEKISASLDRLLAILVPFSELLGVIALIGAALAGFAVGGLAAGAVGATAYIIGGLVGYMNSSLGGTEYKNYGDVNDLVGEALRHYSSLIKATITAISTYMGDLTPGKVLRSLDRLQAFNEVNAVLGKILGDFGKSFGSVIPAFAIIGMTSSKLQGVKATTPEEVSNSFSGIINILKGINNLAVQFEADQTTKLNPAQLVSLTSFMDVVSKNALPLFSALAAIDTVVNSASFKTVAAAEKTFKKAGDILEKITPHIRVVLKNIQTISTRIYEELKDISYENIKEGSEAATEVIKMFSTFVTSIKSNAKDLNVKDIKTVADIFGKGDVVNALRSIMQNTITIASVFSNDSYSQYTLSAISAKTKYYNEFYNSISGLLESYKKISNLYVKEKAETPQDYFQRTTGNDPTKKIAKPGPIEDINPEEFKNRVTGTLSRLKGILEIVNTDAGIPDFGIIAKASSNLNSFKDASSLLVTFLTDFTTMINSVKGLGTALKEIPELDDQNNKNTASFARISQYFMGMNITFGIINGLVNNENINNFIKNMNTFHSLKEPLIKMGEVFIELEKISKTLKGSKDFWKNFDAALPQDAPGQGISEKIGYLKSYLSELSKITAPDFINMLQAVAGIKGIVIDFKTNSAIELLSNLNSFMNSMKAEIDKQSKVTTPATNGPAQDPNLKIEAMSKFLNSVAVPMLLNVKTIADQISNLPMNKTQLERANQTIGSLSQLSGSLTSFSETFMTASSSFTQSFTKVAKPELDTNFKRDGIEGTWKVNMDYIKQRRQNAITEHAELGKVLKGLDAESKKFKEVSAKRTNLLDTMHGTDEFIRLKMVEEYNAMRKDPKQAGDLKVFADKGWIFKPTMVTNADMLKEAMDDKKLKESFKIIADLPKFFNDSILIPFLKGGGASIGPSKIDFVFKSLEGIKKIIELLTGPNNFILTVNNMSKFTDMKNNTSVLKTAKAALDSFGDKELFASFLNSLLVNIIIPMRFAERISGGSGNLAKVSLGFAAINKIITELPTFLQSINIGLSSLKAPDGKGKTGLQNAIDNINSIKDILPKFLETLSYGIILPAVTNLPPIAFIAQASKRLKLATSLGDELAPFINKFADLNKVIGGNLEKINLVDCVGTLIKKLDPADTALSMLADKLIKVKESLQSIADSMTNIVSINGKSDVINVLSKLQLLSNNITDKAKNAVKLNSLDNITSQVQLNNVPDKNQKSDDGTEAIAENTEEMKKLLKNTVASLQGILAALNTQPKSSSNNANTSVSNTGAINLNSGSGNGTGRGLVFGASAYTGAVNPPPTFG